jgi:hypothetical protein
MDAGGPRFGFRKLESTARNFVESKTPPGCISLSKAMNTIPIRPLLTLKLAALAALTLLALLPHLV